MYRHRPILTHVNIMFDEGGLGDLIAQLPAVKFLYNNHPHVKAYVWIPDYFYDFAKNCLRGTEDRILLTKWSEGHKNHKFGYPVRSFRNNPVKNLGLHMTEHAFDVVCQTQPDNKNDYNYLQPDLSKTDITKFNLPSEYVVVTTGFTAAVREFKPEHVNEISKWLRHKNIMPVFLGKKETHSGMTHVIQGNFKTEIDYGLGEDLIDKTSLLEATKVCSKAKAVVGLDNGILHLACTTNVPVVGGYTTVKPEHRMAYRGGILGYNYYPVVPPESLKCRFCQSNWQFDFKQDFKECFYGDTQCTKDLDSSLYINELRKIL